MGFKIVRHTERPDLLARWNDGAAQVWPEFMLHDDVVNRLWGGLARTYPDCQLYLIDDANDTLVGVGNTVPVSWDGTVAGLPDGVDDVLLQAFGQGATPRPANALCALQAGLFPVYLNRSLSSVIVNAMREIAVERGYRALVAPVRPNQKALYPLTPMERYVRWLRSDGLPRDAWLRVHTRLGAEILHLAERSMVVSGTVTAWEAWTGLAFPESGEYVVAGALNPITIDLTADRGTYVEPNVWMRHPL